MDDFSLGFDPYPGAATVGGFGMDYDARAGDRDPAVMGRPFVGAVDDGCLAFPQLLLMNVDDVFHWQLSQ
jgi:hypothetical protein